MKTRIIAPALCLLFLSSVAGAQKAPAPAPAASPGGKASGGKVQAMDLRGLNTMGGFVDTLDARDLRAAEREYLGVTPGVRNAPGLLKTWRPTRAPVLTWVGFQIVGQISRVFIQTTEPAQYGVVFGHDNRLVLELKNTKIRTGNDTRRLDTQFFPSAVRMVNTRRAGRNAQVVIDLAERVPYQSRQEGDFIFLDFQPPSFRGGAGAGGL